MKITVSISFLLFLFWSCSQEEPTLIEDSSQHVNHERVAPPPPSESTLKTNVNRPKAYENAHNVVDVMPLFGGCQSKICSDKKLISYIQKNLNYPESAKSKAVEGRVYVQFIVQSDGSVSDIHVVRDIGSETGAEAVKVVEGINDLEHRWTAGELDGAKVPVVFTLPISFVLE